MLRAISWTYSEDQIVALRQRNAQAETVTPVASSVALENIRFRYSITGDTPLRCTRRHTRRSARPSTRGAATAATTTESAEQRKGRCWPSVPILRSGKVIVWPRPDIS
ncbi:hypothetical protein MPL3365_130583 [Mesorhizobium plurifarium]|uniref:Uncharacterized protein n=1 Tax=Mesorhizobium plurifarium TaxID=69974 RepID=A0A090G3K2_MESPL|nr:hypothetical protein MPL3365_130583 [Mesorhizobium plurifarium]